MVHTYHSITQIEPDLIKGIEHLLKEHVPSYEWIESFEKDQDEMVTYYLFFSSGHNTPVGFGQFIHKKESPKKSLFSFLAKKVTSSHKKFIEWTTPSLAGDSFIFDPLYLNEAKSEVQLLISKIFEEHKSHQKIRLYAPFQKILEGLDQQKNIQNLEFGHSYIKKYDSYKSYMDSLPRDLNQQIKRLWKNLAQNLKLNLGEYHSFNKAIASKKNVNDLKELLDDPSFSKYNTGFRGHILTLEKNNEVSTIIYLIEGTDGNYFYDFLEITPNRQLIELLFHQIVLMKFYEIQEGSRLHFLGDFSNEELQSLGFDSKSYIDVELSYE